MDSSITTLMEDFYLYKHISKETYRNQLLNILLQKYLDDNYDKLIQEIEIEHVESYILLLYSLELNDKNIDKLLHLLIMDGHRMHESIISTIQTSKIDKAVNFIPIAIKAKYDYLHHPDNTDNYYVFVRKCMYALAAIGTEEAIQLIKQYSQDADEEIKELAMEQVKRLGLKL